MNSACATDKPKRKTLHLKFYSEPSFTHSERPGEFEPADVSALNESNNNGMAKIPQSQGDISG